MATHVLNEAKLRELLLYVARKSEGDQRFGAVKLNKILFYSDFAAYRRLGASITGAEYQNLEEGPAPRQLLSARRRLVNDGRAVMETRPYYTGTQQRLTATARGEPNLTLFSAQEIGIIDEVIDELWFLDATAVTERSHLEFGYQATQHGETIPYATAWVSSDPLTDEQIETGIEVGRLHGQRYT